MENSSPLEQGPSHLQTGSPPNRADLSLDKRYFSSKDIVYRENIVYTKTSHIFYTETSIFLKWGNWPHEPACLMGLTYLI